jgi:hypothetical protein
MTRLRIATTLLLLGLPGSAHAADAQYVTERGHLMCTTEAALREAKRAADNQDKAWFDSIKECTRSVAGQKAEVVQEGVLTARIRVFDDAGKPTVYYTTPSVLKEVRR